MADTKIKTVAEELREAAAKLREARKGTTTAPWERAVDVGEDGTDYSPNFVAFWRGEYLSSVALVGDGDLATADAKWICLANPLLAEPLASWLEETAKMFSRSTYEEPGFTVHAVCGGVIGGAITRCACFDKPLAVARVLNGTAS